MLPQIRENQNIYIEITNLQHGGLGWELGTCLWSPKYSKSFSQTWKLMKQVKIDDIIIHLVKLDNQYYFYGISTVSSELIETNEEPPLSDKWADMKPYQRINLGNFNKIDHPYPTNQLFYKYNNILKKVLKDNIDGQFYNLYRGELRVAQRYFAKCSIELYKVFNSVSNLINFNIYISNENNQNIPTINEPQSPDYNSPPRVKTTISRIVRDTDLSRLTKSENNWKCQICGKSILLPNGYYYSEGHHLKPLGGEHQGPDIKENIIIVCPNHHTEFDYGSIAINPNTNLIEHIDETNEFHKKELAYQRTNINNEFIFYHYKKRFNKL